MVLVALVDVAFVVVRFVIVASVAMILSKMPVVACASVAKKLVVVALSEVNCEM